MSGHSKWATIKHKKGATDARRGKLFTKLIKELQVAARMGGGDIDANPRLRKAVSTAKGNQMPGDTIERAIKRGTGELEGTNYEEVTYEGTGPGGTMWMVQAMTDNRNRTVAELRKVFERSTGALGGGGTAAWAFDRKGVVVIAHDAIEEEQLMELALEAGAEHYERDGDNWLVLSDVSDLNDLVQAIDEQHIKNEAAPGYVAKLKKTVTGKDAELCLRLYDALDDHDDTQGVFSDFDVADEELERLLAD